MVWTDWWTKFRLIQSMVWVHYCGSNAAPESSWASCGWGQVGHFLGLVDPLCWWWFLWGGQLVGLAYGWQAICCRVWQHWSWVGLLNCLRICHLLGHDWRWGQVFSFCLSHDVVKSIHDFCFPLIEYQKGDIVIGDLDSGDVGVSEVGIWIDDLNLDFSSSGFAGWNHFRHHFLLCIGQSCIVNPIAEFLNPDHFGVES